MASLQKRQLLGIEQALKAGATHAEIADHLAAAKGIDLAPYREQGASDADLITQMIQVPAPKERDIMADQYQKLSPIDRARVSIGSGMTSLGIGARQAAGLPMRQQDVTDIEAGQSIEQQPGGLVGRIVGQSVPFMAIPAGAAGQGIGRGVQGAGMALNAGRIVNAGTALAASPMADIAAAGAAGGALIPTTQEGERARNMALGAAAGPVLLGAGRVAGAVGQVGRIALNPESVAAEGLLKLANNPAAVRETLKQGGYEIVPGSVPTTAALTRDPGLISLINPVRGTQTWAKHGAPMEEAAAQARMRAIEDVAGSPEQLAAMKAARAHGAELAYQPLKASTVALDAEGKAILGTPIARKALKRAQQLAANNQEVISGKDIMSGRGLQYVKMALDDIANNKDVQKATGIAGAELNALRNVRSQFKTWAYKNIPDYQTADQAYAVASKPIAQMEAGQAVESAVKGVRGQTASGTPMPTAMQFEKALKSSALGKYGNNFSPEAYAALENVAKDIRRSEVAQAKNVVGQNSQTFEKFASRSVADRVLGGNSALAQRVQNLPFFKGRNDEVSDMMARAVIDPRYANQIISALPDAKSQSAMRNILFMLAKQARQSAVVSVPAGAQ